MMKIETDVRIVTSESFNSYRNHMRHNFSTIESDLPETLVNDLIEFSDEVINEKGMMPKNVVNIIVETDDGNIPIGERSYNVAYLTKEGGEIYVRTIELDSELKPYIHYGIAVE